MTKVNLGILGGGQLGSLLAIAAKKLDIKTIIFCDDKDAPVKNYCDEFIFGDYKDLKCIEEFVNKVDLVTFEFENIPFETLDQINKQKKVYPKPEINKVIQNRLLEKNFINNLNIKTTSYRSIKSKIEIESNKNLIPGLLKTCTLGYDGKGQFKTDSINDLKNLNLETNNEFILEKFIDLKKEISIILTRFKKNSYEIYEPIENVHKDQILKTSKIPADINDKLKILSREWAVSISESLDYIGTLCVEFFIDKKDNLYVNEIAPRVHNSGHLTINSHNVSQFENHLRAVCQFEKINTEKMFNAEMINLIGDDILEYRDKKLEDNEFFFDYKKKSIKPKRKMGHLTRVIK